MLHKQLYIKFFCYFLSGDWEQRFDFGVELPPGPLACRQVLLHVALQHAHGGPLVEQLLELLLHQKRADLRLQHADRLGHGDVAQILELTQHACFEENLCGAEFEQVLVEWDLLEYEAGGFDGVHEALGHGIRRQYAVALLELGINHAVGIAFATDSNALQDAVAMKLMQHQMGIQ